MTRVFPSRNLSPLGAAGTALLLFSGTAAAALAPIASSATMGLPGTLDCDASAGGVVVRETACDHADRLLKNPTAVLAPQGLVSTTVLMDPQVLQLDEFTLGWRLEHGGGLLPVTVTVEPANAKVSDGCSLQLEAVPSGTADPVPQAERNAYRLYPPLSVAAAEPWTYTAAHAGLPDHVVVHMSGQAGQDDPSDGYQDFSCSVQLPYVASDGVNVEAGILEGVITALSRFPVDVTVGLFDADSAIDKVVAVQDVHFLALTGVAEDISLNLRAKVVWQSADGEGWDNDYIKVRWTAGGERLVEKQNPSSLATRLTVADGDDAWVCAEAVLYDDELWWFDQEETTSQDEMCLSVSYTQLESSAHLALPLPPACARVLGDAIGLRMPHLPDYIACSRTAPALAGAAFGSLPESEGLLLALSGFQVPHGAPLDAAELPGASEGEAMAAHGFQVPHIALPDAGVPPGASAGETMPALVLVPSYHGLTVAAG